MKNIVLKHGLITGIFITSFMVFYYVIFYPFLIRHNEYCSLGLLGLIGSFSMVFFGILEYRDKVNNHIISFKKAFKIGFLISLMGSLIYLAYYTINYHFFKPSLLEREISYQLRPQKIEHLNKESIQALTDRIKEYRNSFHNPIYFILNTLGDALPFGLFFTLISALILKRKAKL